MSKLAAGPRGDVGGGFGGPYLGLRPVMAPEGGDAGGSAGGGGTPAAGQGTAPAAGAAPAGDAPKPPAAPAELAGYTVEKIKELEKAAGEGTKAAKALAKMQEEMKSPEFALNIMRGAMGLKQESDPQKEIEQLRTNHARSTAVATAVTIENAAMKYALNNGVNPENVGDAVRLMDLEGLKFTADGKIENGDEVFAGAVKALRGRIPLLFKGATKPGEPPPPGIPGGAAPAMGQPPNQPAKPAVPIMTRAAFDALMRKDFVKARQFLNDGGQIAAEKTAQFN